MLSRIAESLFWIGRYVERADSTARILDIHLQLLLEDSGVSEDAACRSLMVVLGSPVEDDMLVTGQHIIDRLTVDQSQPGSIAHSLFSARENARRAREIIAAERERGAVPAAPCPLPPAAGANYPSTAEPE